MPAVSLIQAQAQLDAWMQASLEVASGKSYMLGNGLQVTRENAKYIQQQISYWTRIVERLIPLSEGGRRVSRRYFPIDG
ncbi:MAG: DUF6148 family protein [Veillonellales bacterium]